MRAAVVNEPFNMSIRDVPLPVLGPHDVLLKAKASGICGSDVDAFEGKHFRTTYPRILGHEFCGIVEEVGAEVNEWTRGDRVCAETNIPCRICRICRQGLPHLCKDVKVIGFNMDGGYAEYVKVPAVNLIPLPDSVTFEMAALAQPMGVGYRAVKERSHVKKGDTVAIFGSGPVGLGALAVCKTLGARVIMIDLLENRLEAARKMGADKVVNPSEKDVVSEVAHFTEGDGADIVLEVVGGQQKQTIQQATQIVRRAGIVVVVGTFSGEIPVRLGDLRTGEIDIRGQRGQYGTYKACIDLVNSGQVDMSPMLSRTVSLEEAPYGLELMAHHAGEVVKVLIVQ